MTSDLDEAIRLLRALHATHVVGGCIYTLTDDDVAARQALLARHPEPPKLRPCPFCGSRAIVNVEAPMETRAFSCTSCNARSGGWSNDGRAIAAWNRRTP